MLALFLDHVRVDAYAPQGWHHHDIARAVDIRKNDFRRVARDDFRIEDDAGETSEVSIFGGGGYGEDAGEVFVEVGRDIGGAEPTDFGDDRGIVRRQDLAAVAEAALEAVIVGRIMARRDDHAGMRAQVADGETQLRRRAGADEEISFPTQRAPGAGNELSEVAGEVADIMGDDQTRPGLGGGDMLPETEDGAEDIDVIEAGGTDGGAHGQSLGIELVGGRDPTHGTAAHAARAKRDPFIETVLEFGPSLLNAEILQGGERLGRQGPRAKPFPGVSQTGRGNLTLGLGGLEAQKKGGGGAHESTHPCPPGGGDKPVGGGAGG